MEKDITKPAAGAVEEKLFDNWFDPVETILRDKVRGFLATMIEEELEAVLARPRYGRRQTSPDEEIPAPVTGHRHGHRTRRLMGTFGQTDITVPRARMIDEIGKTIVSANLAAPFAVEIGEACCVLKIEVDANG